MKVIQMLAEKMAVNPSDSDGVLQFGPLKLHFALYLLQSF